MPLDDAHFAHHIGANGIGLNLHQGLLPEYAMVLIAFCAGFMQRLFLNGSVSHMACCLPANSLRMNALCRGGV